MNSCVLLDENNGTYHETFNNTKLVMNHLGHGSETVGGAGSIRKDCFTRIYSMVDAHDKHGSVFGRSRDDDLLSAARQVHASLFRAGKDSSGLADNGSSNFAPRNVC